MEPLSCLLKRAMEEGYISGYKLSRRREEMFHLLFPNDTLIFCKANINKLVEVDFYVVLSHIKVEN